MCRQVPGRASRSSTRTTRGAAEEVGSSVGRGGGRGRKRDRHAHGRRMRESHMRLADLIVSTRSSKVAGRLARTLASPPCSCVSRTNRSTHLGVARSAAHRSYPTCGRRVRKRQQRPAAAPARRPGARSGRHERAWRFPRRLVSIVARCEKLVQGRLRLVSGGLTFSKKARTGLRWCVRFETCLMRT